MNKFFQLLKIDITFKIHTKPLKSVEFKTVFVFTGQSSPTNSEATTAVITTLRRNNNNNINMSHKNNRQNTFNRTLEMNRNNANPMAMGSSGTLPGTLTLGRIKTDRNNYQNG